MKPPIISIHDLMPDTLDQVRGIIGFMASRGLPPACLLVCPGTGWNDEQIEQLAEWEGQGHELAGHGWRHQVASIRGMRHRIHSALLSRRAAEHLALDSTQCTDLIESCFDWFGRHGLRPPNLYVPPAWAMGPVRGDQLRRLPFRFYELLSGVYDSENDDFTHLPVVGFEADTAVRAFSLRCLNAVNLVVARCCRRPLRIAIHPFDLHHRLESQLRNILSGNLCSNRDADTPGPQ